MTDYLIPGGGLFSAADGADYLLPGGGVVSVDVAAGGTPTPALGSTDIAKAYLGSTEVPKLYLGSTLVYDKDA